MDVTAITLGQPVLPGRLPFSKPKVNWLLQEKTVKNTKGVVCLRKNNPKKSKNILLSMAKISKNVKKCVDVIYQQLT